MSKYLLLIALTAGAQLSAHKPVVKGRFDPPLLLISLRGVGLILFSYYSFLHQKYISISTENILRGFNSGIQLWVYRYGIYSIAYKSANFYISPFYDFHHTNFFG